jgi:hypothetical protein
MQVIEREPLTLPMAYAAKDGLPPRPRIIVNILPDGEVRIEGVSYSDRPYLHMRDPWAWKEDQGSWGFASSQPQTSYPSSTQAMANMLAGRAKERMDRDGYSTMSVYIRADADVPFKRIEEIFRACRQAKIYRVSFGVSPRDAWPRVALPS